MRSYFAGFSLGWDGGYGAEAGPEMERASPVPCSLVKGTGHGTI